jgi:hypothetical protein
MGVYLRYDNEFLLYQGISVMRRFEESNKKDDMLDRVFSFLRGKKQGFPFRVKDDDGNTREVNFVRRGQENVSIVDPITNEPGLIPLDRVIVE